MSRLMKRAGMALLTLVFCSIFGQAGWAQYPTKPINVLMGYPAGGTTDSMIRPLCEAAGKVLGQPLVVINKPGGATSVSLVLIKSEKPDGYSIGYLTGSGILMHHQRNLPYDTMKDFTPIIKYMEFTLFGVAVRADSPWKTFKELMDYAKANPGKIKYSTSGAGGVNHLAMECLAKEAGIKWTHVSCKGGAEAATTLLGGHVDVCAGSPEWKPYVESGRLRLLSTFGKKRSSAFPEIPNWPDLGYKTYMTSFGGIIGPKGLPAPIVDRLHNAFKEGMNNPEFRRVVKNLDMEISYSNPEGFTKDIKELNDLLATFMAELGLKKE